LEAKIPPTFAGAAGVLRCAAKMLEEGPAGRHATLMLYHFGTLDEPTTMRRKRHLRPTRGLAIYLLTPGFSRSYHQQVLDVSDTTLAKYMSWSHRLAERHTDIFDVARANAATISAEDGLRMAQRRRRAHMPWWSRLAIAEFVDQLGSTTEVALLFRCSRRTVQLALKRHPLAYEPLSGERCLSRTQAKPPGMWSPRMVEGG
jgi:hypothetical protein